MQPLPGPKIPLTAFRPELYLIIPAAGTGSRMGLADSKQFFKIAGIPVLARTLLTFQDFASKAPVNLHAVIVTSTDDIPRVQALCEEYAVDFVEKIVSGGATRQDSVKAGLDALASLSRAPHKKDVVFIHDGARCMVDMDTLQKCLSAGLTYDVSVAATPCKNTIKCAQASDTEESASAKAPAPKVDKTLDRSVLYEVQTPQVFKYQVLCEVETNAANSGIQATDDTALAEALGIPVHLIVCSYRNIKITTPEDAVIAEALLKME